MLDKRKKNSFSYGINLKVDAHWNISSKFVHTHTYSYT